MTRRPYSATYAAFFVPEERTFMLYTKRGEPLDRRGDDLFDGRGRHVARVRGSRAFGADGRYVGTLVGDRIVYRSTDSAALGPVYARRLGSPFARAKAIASATLGEEPRLDR